MKNTRDLFRENLREIITRRSVKLERAAELCDVSLSFLNQLLSGKSAYSPETIDKICHGLNCTPYDLFKIEREYEKITQRSDKILEIQSILLGLSDDDLDVVKMAAENLSEMKKEERSAGSA